MNRGPRFPYHQVNFYRLSLIIEFFYKGIEPADVDGIRLEIAESAGWNLPEESVVILHMSQVNEAILKWAESTKYRRAYDWYVAAYRTHGLGDLSYIDVAH